MEKDDKQRLLEVMQKVNPELGFNEELRQNIQNPTRLNAPIRKKINRELTALPNYHEGIPLEIIEEILKKYNLLLLQEDYTPWSGFITGREGQADFTLGYFDTAYEQNGLTAYTPIENAALIMTWYKMQSGKYEIVTYIS